MNWIQVLRRAGMIGAGSCAWWLAGWLGGDEPMSSVAADDPARFAVCWLLILAGLACFVKGFGRSRV